MTTVISELAKYLDSLRAGESKYILLEDNNQKLVEFLKINYGNPSDTPVQPYDYLPGKIFNRTEQTTPKGYNSENKIRTSTPLKTSAPVIDTPAPPQVKHENKQWEKTENIENAKNIDTLRLRIINCGRCGLCEQRTRIVFGAGNLQPNVFFIGEGPGQEEDQQGLPFVGKSGKLLTQMIQAIGMNRQGVYISNVVKCRPPKNRNPEPGEVASCLPILHRQIQLLNPKLIVLLGGVALKALFGNTVPGITAARGKMMTYQNIPLIPTFHPSYLLRSPQALYSAWDDFRKIRSFIHAQNN